MAFSDDDLDLALADYLDERERDDSLLPSQFAASLPDGLREEFLREVEALAEIDRLALAPPRDLPRRFGDYRILRQLGRGGMGTVYEAEDIRDGRSVALKILHPAVGTDPKMLARFHREAETASAIDHPRVVSVLGTGEQEGFHFLVMNHVRGCSLARLIAARHDPRDVDHIRARNFFANRDRLLLAFAEVSEAVAFAHDQSVIHRDIKPANLMVDPDGQIHVLDFGLARSLESTDHALTRTQEFIGTPMYMAPEQARGDRDAAPANDVYALGAVLYECLVGEPAFRPGPLPQILAQIEHLDPVSPRRRRRDIPRRLSDIVVQTLEKNPGRRYETAGALAADLRRVVAGEPVSARAVGVGTRVGRGWSRRPGLYSTAVVAILVAVAGLVYGLKQRDDNRSMARDKDLQSITDALALAPEGIIVCGGLALNWYANFGLGQHLPPGVAISAPARRAIAAAEGLLASYPSDPRVIRRVVRAYIDVGRLGDARRLVEELGDEPGDRALRALTLVFDGDLPGAQTAFQLLGDATDPDARYFRAVFDMVTHRHTAAVREFTAALDSARDRDGSPVLSEEYRYYAHLMRGWCRSLPEIGDFRGAQDDLRSAAALRPRYGTPQLLWAALRALDPETAAAGEAVTEAGEILASVQAPWLTVLTARLLLGLAEPSADLPGPLSFNGDVSPLIGLPLEDSRWRALVQVARDLLSGLREAGVGGYAVDVHYATALALQREFDAALTIARGLASQEGVAPVLPPLLAARIELAAGRTGAAGRALAKARAADPRHPQVRLCAADLARARGDGGREAHALWTTARSLPPHSGLLPRIQRRLAMLYFLRREYPEAIEVLHSTEFGNGLSGTLGDRAVAERAVLGARLLQAIGAGPAVVRSGVEAAEGILDSLPEDAPLRSLASHLATLRESIGEPGRARRLRDQVQSVLAHDWWRPLVFWQRGWLALTPEAESRALERSYAAQPNARVIEAMARVQSLSPQRVRSLMGESRRAAHHLILAGALLRDGQADAARKAVAVLTDSSAGEVGRDLHAAIDGLQIDSSDPVLRDAVLHLAEREGASAGQSAATSLKALTLLFDQRWREAEPLLIRALADDPDNLKHRYLLAIARVQSGRIEAAVAGVAGRIQASTLPDFERRLGLVNARGESSRPLPGARQLAARLR